MTRLEHPRYLDHIAQESQRFRDVLASGDPDAQVPSCPDWTAADLLWHLGTVQRFWSETVRQRPATPDPESRWDEPERPGSHAALVAFFDASSAALQEALTADPAAEAWTWSDDHTVGFIIRRQAHEALIHRLDAELAAGQVTDLDPRLATDGIQEVLDVMFGGCPPWGTFTPGTTHLRVDVRDTEVAIWVNLGRFTGTNDDGKAWDEADLQVVDDPGTVPDAVLAGDAGDLDAWLWHRRADPGFERTGDRSVHDTFSGIVDQPIT